MTDKDNKKELLKIAQQKGFLIPEDILRFFPDPEESIAITEELTGEGIILLRDNNAPLNDVTFAKDIDLGDIPVTRQPTDEESLHNYMQRLGEVRKITEQENAELLQKVQDGSEEALQVLLEVHQPLVIYWSKKFKGKGMSIYDVIQEGNFGLMKAIQKFGSKKDKDFKNFAANMIKDSIGKAIKAQGRSMRLPKDIINIMKKLHKTSAEIAQKEKRTPKLEEVARAANIPIEQVMEIAKTSSTPLSLATPLGEDKSAKLGDHVPRTEDEVWNKVEQGEDREELLDMISELPPLDQQIISLSYGLIDGKEWTLGEIAAFMNITEEQVQEIKEKSLEELKKGNRE